MVSRCAVTAAFMVFSITSLASSALASSVVELAPVRDNTLFESQNGSLSSGAGMFLFAGMNSDSTARRALLAFDVSSIPADAIIDSVFLEIHVSRVNNESVEPLSAHRVLDSWGEGTSDSGSGGGGATSETGDATWIHRFYPDQTWANPGGDFDSSPSASISTGAPGVYTFSGDGLAEDVRSWIASPETAHGWLLRGDESEPTTARRIDSRENTDPQSHPKLIVYFTPMIDPVIEASWGRVKARF